MNNSLSRLKKEQQTIAAAIAIMETRASEPKAARFSKPVKRTQHSVPYRTTKELHQLNIGDIDGHAELLKLTQQAQFDDALKVMIELRMQPGIVDPSKTAVFYVVNFKKSKGVWIGQHVDMAGQVMGPAFRTPGDVSRAIAAVGEDRIWQAFETLLFIGC